MTVRQSSWPRLWILGNDMIVYYRTQQGELLTATELRRQAKANGLRVQVFLPSRESRWTEETLEKLGVSRVWGTDAPKVDPRFHNLDGRQCEKQGKRWVQVWTVTPKFRDKAELKKVMKETVEEQMARKMRTGFDGSMGFRLNEGRTSRRELARRLASAANTHKIVDQGNAYVLNDNDLRTCINEIDAYLDSTENGAAALMETVDAAVDPLTVNIDDL